MTLILLESPFFRRANGEIEAKVLSQDGTVRRRSRQDLNPEPLALEIMT